MTRVAMLQHQEAGVGAGLDQAREHGAVAQLGAHHEVVGQQSLHRPRGFADDSRTCPLQLAGHQLELVDVRVAGVDRWAARA